MREKGCNVYGTLRRRPHPMNPYLVPTQLRLMDFVTLSFFRGESKPWSVFKLLSLITPSFWILKQNVKGCEDENWDLLHRSKKKWLLCSSFRAIIPSCVYLIKVESRREEFRRENHSSNKRKKGIKIACYQQQYSIQKQTVYDNISIGRQSADLNSEWRRIRNIRKKVLWSSKIFGWCVAGRKWFNWPRIFNWSQLARSRLLLNKLM